MQRPEEKMYLTQLTDLISRPHADFEDNQLDLPNVSILRRDAPSRIEAYVYEPVLCLILQGGKAVTSGDLTVNLGVADALLVSHDLPVVSQITEASAETPYLAVILTLDLAIIRSLEDLVGEPSKLPSGARSLAAGTAEPMWLAPLVRYVELAVNPQDQIVLGSATLREIHYRLMLSSIGGMLRNLLIADSHASRIAKAIAMLRSNFQTPLAVSELANAAAMSTSSFHQHFKAVTGTTPLQYQKDLRLIEAKALLVETHQNVSQAAYAVGYESPNHFSRDYSRKFGVPPSNRRRKQELRISSPMGPVSAG